MTARLLDPAHRAFTVGIVAVMTMFAFEGIGVGTAMPVVAAELDGLGSYAWAFGGYVVASLVGMVLAGEWADARGPRQPLLVGVAGFAVGALLCGAAWSMPALVAGRLVQGLGGGVGIVAIYVVLGRGFDEELRPKAFVLLSTAWVVPAIVGPFVAGFLTDNVSWRAVFWLVVPLVIPPVWLLSPRLGRLGGGGEVDRGDSHRRLRLAVVAAAGLALVQEGAARVGRVGALLAIAGLALIVPSLGRLLPAGTWRFARGLPAVVILRGLMAGAFFGGESFVPLALQTQRGLGPTHSGLVLTAGALGWTLGAFVQGRMYRPWGPVRLLRLGTSCCVVGLVSLPLCLLPSVSPYVAAASWTIGAVGMGLSFGTLGNETLALSAPADQGENSAALQLCDSTGSVLLIGLAGSVYAGAVAAGSVDRQTFTIIFLAMAAVMALGVAMSGRVRPSRRTVPSTTLVG